MDTTSSSHGCSSSPCFTAPVTHLMVSPSAPSCSRARLFSNQGPFTVFHRKGGSGTLVERAAAAPSGVAAPYDITPVNQRRNRGNGFRTDRKSTRLNSSHANISYAVFCLKKKKTKN